MIDFKAICLFANLRTGSTFVCQQLAHGMSHVHDKKVIQLYEYLSSAVAYTKDWRSILIDPTHRVPRPFMTALDIDRLRKLPKMISDDLFPILKIFPEDYTHANYDSIHRYIIDDPTVYKICLNRADIRNQFLSYFIARSTNKFHVYQGDMAENDRQYSRIKVSIAEMDEIRNVILMHYSWHAANADSYCHKTLWYHEMLDTTYPDLGLSKDQIIYDLQIKAVNDHQSMAQKCIENYDEVDAYARKLESNLAPLRRDLLPEYLDGRDW